MFDSASTSPEVEAASRAAYAAYEQRMREAVARRAAARFMPRFDVWIEGGEWGEDIWFMGACLETGCRYTTTQDSHDEAEEDAREHCCDDRCPECRCYLGDHSTEYEAYMSDDPYTLAQARNGGTVEHCGDCGDCLRPRDGGPLWD